MKQDYFTKQQKTRGHVNQLIEYKIGNNYPNQSQFEIHNIKEAVEFDQDVFMKSHIHDFYLIVWFEKGSGKHVIDFKEYDINSRTVFFVAPGQIHKFKDVVSYDGYSIVFTEDFLYIMTEMLHKYVKNEIFGSYRGASICSINNDSLAEEFKNKISGLVNEYENGVTLFAYKDRLALLLSDLIVTIKRYGTWSNQEEGKQASQDYTYYLNFVDYVEKHFYEIHNVKSYAQELHLSIGTLNKNVTKICGKSPLEVINDRIILEAKRILNYHLELKVKQVAGLLGFSDVSNFVKFFKHNTSMTPSDFRKLD